MLQHVRTVALTYLLQMLLSRYFATELNRTVKASMTIDALVRTQLCGRRSARIAADRAISANPKKILPAGHQNGGISPQSLLLDDVVDRGAEGTPPTGARPSGGGRARVSQTIVGEGTAGGRALTPRTDPPSLGPASSFISRAPARQKHRPRIVATGNSPCPCTCRSPPRKQGASSCTRSPSSRL